jgi:hypothetical protein
MNMSARDAYKLIDEMAFRQQQWMQKSIDRLTNQNISVVHQSPTCVVCGGGDHLVINCNWGGSAEGDAEQVNVLNNYYQPQNNPYSNSYNS